jgi:hypothetical protein
VAEVVAAGARDAVPADLPYPDRRTDTELGPNASGHRCATGTMGTAEQVADVRASIRPLRRRWPSVTKRSLMLEGASTDCLEPRARGLPACP